MACLFWKNIVFFILFFFIYFLSVSPPYTFSRQKDDFPEKKVLSPFLPWNSTYRRR